jgi:hypothetical protein
MEEAAKAVSRLVNLVPPIDVGEPEEFMQEAVILFAEYPAQIWTEASRLIVRKTKRFGIDDVKAALEEIFAPMRRALERQRSEDNHLRGLPPPDEKRTPEEQARINEHVERVRSEMGIPEGGFKRGYRGSGSWR